MAVNGKKMSPAALFKELNVLGGRHGIGRIDMVENRFVGMKSRGVYETPGGTILRLAHMAMESITLDREVAHLRDSLIPRYAELIYYGFWFSPEMRLMQNMIDETQANVCGDVRLKLYKGNAYVLGRRSERSLYNPAIASFEDDKNAYRQKDAEGFIRLNALRLRNNIVGRAAQHLHQSRRPGATGTRGEKDVLVLALRQQPDRQAIGRDRRHPGVHVHAADRQLPLRRRPHDRIDRALDDPPRVHPEKQFGLLPRLDLADFVHREKIGVDDAAEERRRFAHVFKTADMLSVYALNLVTGLGHTVSGTAATRTQARAAVAEAMPGLVLADIQLADNSSGVEAVNEILAQFGNIPVIFITALSKMLPDSTT